MNEMKSFSSALQAALRTSSSGSELAAKAARAEKVRRMWKVAVESCAGRVAPVILDHTNSVYIIREELKNDDVSRETSGADAECDRSSLSRQGKSKKRASVAYAPGELVVYLEDSLIAAEVDARREMIKLKFLELFGEELGEFRIRISRGKYKLNHPYRKSDDEKEQTPLVARKELSRDVIDRLDEGLSDIGDEKMREALKRAMISDLEIKNALEVDSDKNRAS